MNILLSTAYLPPISYFSLFTQEPRPILEAHEHFQKQSFRSRCHILSPQGYLALTVPVEKVRGLSRREIPIRDVKISYDFNWQRIHRMSIESCYRRSTYFEYYEDRIAPFFTKKFPFLWDLNMQWMDFLTQVFEIKVDPWKISSEFIHSPPQHFLDLRKAIHPKNFVEIPTPFYPQVFGQELGEPESMQSGFGQGANLSVLDLLFNLGKQGKSYLRAYSSIVLCSYSNGCHS